MPDEQPKILKHGTILIKEDGQLLVQDFKFGNVNFDEAAELALRWGLQRIKECMWERGIRNLND